MLQGGWAGQWEYWDKFNNDPVTLDHVVMFDGPSKTIWILSDVSEVDVKQQLYSDWKEWISLYDNSKYLQAFGTEGGRPISDTEKLGDTYFLLNDWIIRQRDATTTTNIIGNLYAYDLNDNPKDPYGFDPDGLKSISSQTSLLVSTVVQTKEVVVEVPVYVEVEVPAQGLTSSQETTLNLAYEEARRGRAMQTNKVGISTVGTGVSALDTIQVFDDDGVTLLYTIVVTGENADNRQVTYIKPYPS